MKTIHQHLLEADSEAIFERYLQRRPIYPYVETDTASTAEELLERRRQLFMRFCEELLNLSPVQNEKMVFLASEEFIDGRPEICPILISLEDLNNGAARNIDWRTTDRDKLMGFLVADTKLTRENLCDILAQILDKASFFGFSAEEFERSRKEYNRMIKEFEKDWKKTLTLPDEYVSRHYGLPMMAEDPRAEELLFRVLEAEAEYSKYCKERELDSLRSSLPKANENPPSPRLLGKSIP